MDMSSGLVLGRWAFFSTAMILFGSSLFRLYTPIGATTADSWPWRGAARALSALALVSAVWWLAALCRELDASRPMLETMKLVLIRTTFGPSWLARLTLGVCACAASLMDRRVLLAAAAGGLLICEGWDGHAAAHGYLGETLQAVHALCAGGWIGALFPLAFTLAKSLEARRPDSAMLALRRFSSVNVVFVLAIVLTGVGSAILIRPKLSLDIPYARVLGVKVALVATMIALAAFNRLRLMPKAEKSDGPAAIRTLIATIAFEQGLALAVLLVVAVLGLLAPYASGN